MSADLLCFVEGRPPVARCLSMTAAQAAKLRPAFERAPTRRLRDLGAPPTGTVAILSGRARRPTR